MPNSEMDEVHDVMESRHERRRRERVAHRERAEEERRRAAEREEARLMAVTVRCLWCGLAVVPEEDDDAIPVRCTACGRAYEDKPANHEPAFVDRETADALARRQCAALEAIADIGSELADHAGALIELLGDVGRQITHRVTARG